MKHVQQLSQLMGHLYQKMERFQMILHNSKKNITNLEERNEAREGEFISSKKLFGSNFITLGIKGALHRHLKFCIKVSFLVLFNFNV